MSYTKWSALKTNLFTSNITQTEQYTHMYVTISNAKRVSGFERARRGMWEAWREKREGRNDVIIL